MELPGDINERIWLTMMADPNARLLSMEQVNSSTHLFAAAFSYMVLKKFRSGTTQHKVQDQFGVRPKQLANCLTGRKYLGGTDRKSLSRKHKASGDGDQPSTSK